MQHNFFYAKAWVYSLYNYKKIRSYGWFGKNLLCFVDRCREKNLQCRWLMWESWGRAPSRRRPTRARRRSPRRCGDFAAFFLKKYAFVGVFWSKFPELSVLMRPEARVPTCPLLLQRHWVGRLKAMTNCLYCRTVCSFSHNYNLRNSYCKLFSLNHQNVQLLMRDRAYSIYQTWRESLISDFNSTPTPTNSTSTPLRLRTFQTLETNVVTSKSQFTLASVLVSILKFVTILQLHSDKLTKNALRLHSESDKKRHTPIPIRLRVLPISGIYSRLRLLYVLLCFIYFSIVEIAEFLRSFLCLNIWFE